MKEPYIEGVATHDDPESCATIREGRSEALTGARTGSALSRENRQSTLWSPAAILKRPSSHDAYYERYSELRPVLSEADTVLLPESRAAFDLAAITGASVVISPNAHRVPDRVARSRNVRSFFNPKTRPEVRIEIARRYGVSKIVLPRRDFGMLGTLTKNFGGAIHRSNAWAVLSIPH